MYIYQYMHKTYDVLQVLPILKWLSKFDNKFTS